MKVSPWGLLAAAAVAVLLKKVKSCQQQFPTQTLVPAELFIHKWRHVQNFLRTASHPRCDVTPEHPLEGILRVSDFGCYRQRSNWFMWTCITVETVMLRDFVSIISNESPARAPCNRRDQTSAYCFCFVVVVVVFLVFFVVVVVFHCTNKQCTHQLCVNFGQCLNRWQLL